MLQRNQRIRLSAFSMYQWKSIFSSIVVPSCTGCFVLGVVDVLKSSVDTGVCLSVSDRRLC